MRSLLYGQLAKQQAIDKGAAIVAQGPVAAATATDDPRVDRIRQYLAAQDQIRVGVSGAPGHGHQAAALTVVQELRALGYQKEIVLVADDEETRAKVETLLLGHPDIRPAPRVVTTLNRSDKKIDLAFYGARDKVVDTDLHEKTKARNVVVLQPHQWPEPRLVSIQSEQSRANRLFLGSRQPPRQVGIDQLSKVYLQRVEEVDRTQGAALTYRDRDPLSKSRLTYHSQRIAPPEDLHQHVGTAFAKEAEVLNARADMALRAGDQVEANALRAKAAQRGPTGDTLNKMLEAARQGKVEVMTTYGLDFNPAIDRVVQGVQRAQERGKVGGTVIVLTKDCDDSVLAKLPGSVKLANAHDPAAAQLIESLGQQDVLVLKAGSVPKDVFNELIRESTLPAVYEGANTTNIGRLMGKPNMSWNLNNTPLLPSSDPSHALVVEKLKNIATGLTNPNPRAVADDIADYIIDARAEHSKVQEYFTSEQQQFLKPENNAILSGIDCLLESGPSTGNRSG